MSIRILGGLAKGLSLVAPKGATIRPTSVMMRRRLFDAKQNWRGLTFVDACAGTGSMGIEAWSRFADEIFLIEANRKVYEALKRNFVQVKTLFPDEYAERNIKLQGKPFEKWVDEFFLLYESWDQEKQENTYLFIDPPYHMLPLYRKLVARVQRSNFKGHLWIESDEQKGITAQDLRDLGLREYRIVQQRKSFVFMVNFSSPS